MAMQSNHLLTPLEVATLFRVDPKTVTRWANAGKLKAIRTIGGHRRYRVSEIRNLFDASEWAELVDEMDLQAGTTDIPDHRRVTS